MPHRHQPACRPSANRATFVRRAILATLLASSCALASAAVGIVRADEGEALYRTLCASCHGASGRGDGPAAQALTPPPADLTKSSLNLAELMTVIDGRRTVRAHGDAAMPVWGRVFEQALAGTGHEHRGTLQQEQMLAEYVRSLEGGAAAAK